MPDAVMRRGILESLLRNDGVDPRTIERIPPPLDDQTAPCSFMQRALWLADDARQSSVAYHVPVLLRIAGPLDYERLATAIEGVADRHEILRTTITTVGGVPVQSVWPSCAVDLAPIQVDASGDAAAAFIDAAREIARAPFDTEMPFPWRVALLRAGPLDHCLAFSFHHLVFDGESIPLLSAAIAAGYAGTAPGCAPADAAALQYADYSAWQHALDLAGRFDEHVDYWVRELADLPSLVSLGGDRGSHAGHGLDGDTVRVPLDGDLVNRLQAAARSNDATVFAAGLAAWSGWLAERSGVDRLLVATPVSRRDGPFAALIGPVMNTVALHINVDAAENYASLVRQVRDKTRAAVAHRDAPLERVLERLRPPRPARSLTNIGFLRQRTLLPKTAALPAEQIPMDLPGAQTDAALELDSRGGRWGAVLRYSSDVFSRAAAARALDDFIAYFREVTAAPEAGRRTGAVVPLTPTQVRVWADQQRSPEAPLYNVASAVEIEGHVDPEILAGAFAEVVGATDALRLGVVLRAHGPALIETSQPLPPLEVVDAGRMSDDEYTTWLEVAVRRPFDLRGPLYRSFLIRGVAGSTWLLVQHHLITDGWSVRLLCDRVSEAYVRRSGLAEVDASSPAEPQPVSQWTPLLRAAAAQPCAGDEDWWRNEFEGVVPPRLFGTLPRKGTTAVTRSRVPFDGTTAGRVRQFPGGAAGLSAFAVSAAGIVALLHRLTGETRIPLGVVVHQRRTPAERATVGLFMDVVPIVVECGADDSLETLAARALRSLRRSLARGTPPTDVRERACDVLLNVQTTMFDRFAGLPALLDWVSPGHERESLALHVYDAGQRGVGVDIDTHDEVCDATEHTQIARLVRMVIEQSAANPAARVRDLRLTDAQQLAELVTLGTGARRPDAPLLDVMERVRSIAMVRPGSVAVDAGPHVWTYGDLADRVGRSAAMLARRGVGRGDVVLVAGERRPEFVAAVLAILELGAAYLPLEADMPPARLAQLRRDAQPRLAVGSIPFAGIETVSFESLTATAEEWNASPPVAAELPAYLIATSGSTGAPKLVQIPRRALSNYASFAAEHFELLPSDRVLQFASLGFDTAVEEIFPTLVAGATLVLRDEPMLAGPATLARRLRERRITVLNLPTSHWHELASSGEPLPECVRLTLVGGDAMRASVLSRWKTVAPHCRLLNGYGPTEATVVATFADVTTGASEPVPIGRPIWNSDLVVLDGCGVPAPPGVAGELLIGGAGLADGYRHDAALTGARFVPHPLDSTRLAYRTGDRVRLRQGRFEYLGRIDDQVKIRGFRVAPEEIVAALRTCPSIADAVVLADRTRENSLRAYVVPAPGLTAVDTLEVKAALRQSLPEYMVPPVIVAIPAIPRTATGKVDRAALESRDVAPELARKGQHPATATELWFSDAWFQLSGSRPGDVDVNLFDIGGHSLLVARLVARVPARFGIEMPLRTVFEYATVRQLAAWIDAHAPATPDRRATAAVSQ